ncbi:MAG: hypothetical protein WCH34_16715 [Bacteroidota bacterium]
MRKYKKIAYACVIIIFSSCLHLQKNELKELVGTNINDKKFQSFLNNLNEKPVISTVCKVDITYYYSFPKKGICISILKSNDNIAAIFLYSEGVDNYRQYQGQLPNELDFQNSRKEVESKLGPPDSVEIESFLNYFSCSWKDGTGVTYKNCDASDMSNKIKSITISTFK